MSTLLFPTLQSQLQKFEKEFQSLSTERKKTLEEITAFVHKQLKAKERANLNFICTHNSRRSHISQLWAQAAAAYYEIENVHCYSGGTEATAFNPRAVKAMSDVGFKIVKASESENPRYVVSFGEHTPTVMAFSKVYSDSFNPATGFAAIMTCSHADENCPLVIGTATRISLPFNDPKEFDGTPQETQKYAERVKEIGMEIAYAFSRVNKQ